MGIPSNSTAGNTHGAQANGFASGPGMASFHYAMPHMAGFPVSGWGFYPALQLIPVVPRHSVHPWFAGRDEVNYDDPDLPRVFVDPRWPYTPAGVYNAHLPRFEMERINRVIEVPGSFIPFIGLLYPSAEFAVARVPASQNPVQRMHGIAMAKGILLDRANANRRFLVCLRRRDWYLLLFFLLMTVSAPPHNVPPHLPPKAVSSTLH